MVANNYIEWVYTKDPHLFTFRWLILSCLKLAQNLPPPIFAYASHPSNRSSSQSLFDCHGFKLELAFSGSLCGIATVWEHAWGTLPLWLEILLSPGLDCINSIEYSLDVTPGSCLCILLQNHVALQSFTITSSTEVNGKKENTQSQITLPGCR